jgi:hypothetical protein
MVVAGIEGPASGMDALFIGEYYHCHAANRST